jgi:hypothetical protein
MRKEYLILFLYLSALTLACSPTGRIENPPSAGFDTASDPKAILVADDVMKAMGGRTAWDNTRYIKWNFFGRRTLLWDKYSGWVRIEWSKKPLKVIVNVQTGAGKVELNGVNQTHPDSLAKYLDIGKKVWINDSYWLVMPFKLKDSGVTLKYLGDSRDDAQQDCHLLQLTFKNVGVTPDNKYHVWVDKNTKLVSQWAYFEKFSETSPQLKNAWKNYQRYGQILLSDNRGKADGELGPIEVSDTQPPGIFDQF